MLNFVTLLLISLAGAPVLITAANPGAKIRLSQSGLDYGANVAVQILSAKIDQLSVPDVEDSANIYVGKVEYKVSNMKVTNFRQPSTSVTLKTGNNMTWSVSNAEISLSGNWSYKLKVLFIPIQDSGSFTGDVSGVSVNLSVNLGIDASGRPTISYSDCSSQVQNISIKLSGGASWLNDLLINRAIKPVRGELEKLICEKAQEVIATTVAKELASFPIQVEISNGWMVDYRLVHSPLSSESYLETEHAGKIFHRDDASVVPFQAEILPNPSSAARMVTVWLSDYILNTAGYALHTWGILQYTFTAKDLPEDNKGYLDTICSNTSTCIGGLIPRISELYPKASVEIAMSVTDAPKVEISQTGIHGTVVAEISFSARLPNASLSFMFNTSVQIALSLTASFDGRTVKGRITNLTPTIEITDTTVGPISEQILTDIFQTAAKVFIIPQLNTIGEKGFQIPLTQHVNFTQPNVMFDSHALRLTSDIEYSP